MGEIKDGPAFPWGADDDFSALSKRDFFAGLAMQALIGRGTYDGAPDDLTVTAYRVADAMLRAREQ